MLLIVDRGSEASKSSPIQSLRVTRQRMRLVSIHSRHATSGRDRPGLFPQRPRHYRCLWRKHMHTLLRYASPCYKACVAEPRSCVSSYSMAGSGARGGQVHPPRPVLYPLCTPLLLVLVSSPPLCLSLMPCSFIPRTRGGYAGAALTCMAGRHMLCFPLLPSFPSLLSYPFFPFPPLWLNARHSIPGMCRPVSLRCNAHAAQRRLYAAGLHPPLLFPPLQPEISLRCPLPPPSLPVLSFLTRPSSSPLSRRI